MSDLFRLLLSEALYLWIIGKYGMYVSVPAGLDGLNYVDAFTTANFE